MSTPIPNISLVEEAATLEDFFSDEFDDDDDDDDDDESDVGGTGRDGGKQKQKRKRGKDQGKKKGKNPGSTLASSDLCAAEFRKRGKELIDFIADYIESSRDKPVNHQVNEGFIFRKMPKLPSREPVGMDDVYKELKQFILPGLPQWQSPKHHALMPAGGSYASLLGSMLCDGLGCISLTWGDCPAATELEMVVMNWLAHLLDLPTDFHFFGKGATGGGGGMIQGTTTESLLTIAVSAKRLMLDTLKAGRPQFRNSSEWEIQDRLIAYCSEQAHPSMERVAEVAGIRLKRLWTDSKGVMHADTLRFALEKDRENGLYPFLVIATVGTIGSTSVDQIAKIGPLLETQRPQIWFHIESCYAGSSFICREYQPLLHGIDFADSFSMSAHKWMPVHMDCACLWVKKAAHLTYTFGCEDPEGPLTIPAENKSMMADYRHWSLPMSRRFRAMKLWMVFKLYGTKGLQQKIREDVRRAKELEKMINDDHRFEIMGDTMFAIVPFRCKRPNNNEINHEILKQLNKAAVIKMTGATVNNKLWLRYVVAGRHTDSDDVRFTWDIIRRTTNRVITEYTEKQHMEGRYGVPNYTHVNKIGVNERLDNQDTTQAQTSESDTMVGHSSEVTLQPNTSNRVLEK